MGAVLLAAGAKGKRFALPHSRIMIHQPWGGARGTAADIEIHAEEILKTKRTLTEIISRHTGRPLDSVDRDTDRDKFMDPHQAKEYGLVDEVVDTLKDGKPKKA
jgi:ATP-dependent Clp protease protease subunit